VRSSLIWLTTTVLIAASCWASFARAGQRYVDHFDRGPSVWRFGNVPTPVSPDGLVLNPGWQSEGTSPGIYETTLPGTVLNPGNLETFAISLRWSFGKVGNPTLGIGWEKPSEWTRFQDSPVRLQIERGGRTSLYVEGKLAAGWQLPEGKNGEYALTVVREPGRVLLRSGLQDIAFSMAGWPKCRPGYLALQLQGTDGALATIRRIEINTFGDRPPLTAAQRRADIQRWARAQMREDDKMLEQLKAYLQAETAAGRWGYKTDMDVAPGLVRPGEKLAATFRIAGPIPSPCEATLEGNYLGENPDRAEILKLDWKPDGHGGAVAVVEMSPTRPGNGRIVWRVGRERLSRMFGVLGDGYAACRLLLTAYVGLRRPGRTGEAYDVLHRHGLAADFWDGSEHAAPYVRSPRQLAEEYRVFATMRHQYGDHIMPMCQGNYMLSRCPDSNLSCFDLDVQRWGIQRLMQVWDQLGIGPLETLGSYTYSHDTPRAARQLGIKAIDSLVQWQNWRDGGDDSAWLINQWGAPTAPYYVADDDYRKVATGQSIVALSQGTTSSVRMYFINMLEGQPQLTALRRYSAQMGETANADRFQTVVDLCLAEARHQREPMFLFVGLENFCDLADWDRANTLAVNYLREQAKTKKLVFTSGAAVADYFTRHYTKQPENWFYWPDTYCGYQIAYKPKRAPDRIELSNAEFHSVHEEGSPLPRFFWDFTHAWSEPVWDDQKAIRQQFGLCDPKLLTAENCVPRMVNLDGVRATAKMAPTADGAQIQIEIESPKPLARVPVAAWNIPLKTAGLKVAETSKEARFITIVDGSTENLCGVVVYENVVPGRSIRTVRLQGAPREPVDPTVRVGQHVAGRMFLRNGVPYVYLWRVAEKAPEGVLNIRVPGGRRVAVHYNDGKIEQAAGNVLAVKLDRTWATESPLVMGLTQKELASMATFEPQAKRNQ